MGARGGFEPPRNADNGVPEVSIQIPLSVHMSTREADPSLPLAHGVCISAHQCTTFVRGTYGIYMGDLPDDLRTVIAVWPSLPGAVKGGIVAMVHAARPQ